MSDATLTPDKALALRQPFPAESVGKLPKPNRADAPKGQCGVCGGWHGLPAVHLDYVGHAAVTDRLLTVDPEWNWEPFAIDANGLPSLDGRGNLWIRLTICGVTRIGVGDGKSLKECIGDAIRNAAMRFGVALDLWAKEDLVEFRNAVVQSAPVSLAEVMPEPERTEPEPEPEPVAPPTTGKPPKISAADQGRLFALFKAKGIPEADQASGIAALIGRPIEHRTEMTGDEFALVIKRLSSLPDAAPTGQEDGQ